MNLTPYQRLQKQIKEVSRFILVLALLDLVIVILIIFLVLPILTGHNS